MRVRRVVEPSSVQVVMLLLLLPVSREALSMRVRRVVEPSLVETSDFWCFFFRLIKLAAAGSRLSRLSLSMCLARRDQKARSWPSFLATRWRFPRIVVRIRGLGGTLLRPRRIRLRPLATARQSWTRSELARPDWRMLR